MEEDQLGLSVEGHVGANGRGDMQRSTSAELRTCARCFHLRSNPHKVETEAWGPDGSRDLSVWEPVTGDPQSDMRRYPGRHPGWRESRTLLQVTEVRREATAQEALSGQEWGGRAPNRTLPRGLLCHSANHPQWFPGGSCACQGPGRRDSPRSPLQTTRTFVLTML